MLHRNVGDTDTMVNWSDIDTVLLDMDGTLLDLSFDNYFWLEYLPEKVAQHKAIALDEARRSVQALSASVYGSLDWYCLDYWSNQLTMDIEALKLEIRHLVRQRPHCTEFLLFLRELGKNVILVTNAHPKSLHLKIETSGLDAHLDRMISSHEFALAKENTGFWHQLQQRERIDLARSLFIDDSLAVLECARDEGVGQTIQVLHPDTTQAPRPPAGFPAIHHFTEIMTASP